VPELPKITQTSPSIWEEVIREEAQKEGVDQDLLVSIARCESGFHPSVHNATSTASGLYQFLDSTWASQSAKYGITTQKDDPYGQIELAVKMIRDGGLSHWKASQSCWK
jgi:soluble lytic murein transglycosylase-like protein